MGTLTAAIMTPITGRSITNPIIISRAIAIARVMIMIPIIARGNAITDGIIAIIDEELEGQGSQTVALSHSSSNNPASCSIIAPPNCSASMIVTARL
jgi:hypothetical protein